jgi:hypothetical protein
MPTMQLCEHCQPANFTIVYEATHNTVCCFHTECHCHTETSFCNLVLHSYVNLVVEKTNFVLVFTMKFILCD